MVILGWILSGLVILFMIFDGVIKLPPLKVVTDTMAEINWPTDKNTSRFLGILGLTCTALYAFPSTTLLGAILLTGYLGGAIATQVRRGNQAPLFSHKLFGVYIGVLMWAGLLLRAPEIRAIMLPF